MASKRLLSEVPYDEQPNEKRMKAMPSFASVLGEVMLVKSINSFCHVLEPMLRKVVHEEVELGLQKTMRSISKSPSFRIQAPEPVTLKLVFTNKSLPTSFTCNKLADINGEPLQLSLVEQRGDQVGTTSLSSSIKVEIVVIDGDFPPHDCNVWTAEEFSRRVVKPRDGRRPLIAKEAMYVMKDKSCVNVSEIELTDNSSWIRSRKFRIGARVIGGATCHGVRILEALTEPFVVKDHRGELYRKHYPPMLDDEVWRLEKIGKDGKFHRRLDQEGIHTVQDLLKLSVVDEAKLKKVLGGKKGISERMWDAITKHARTCNVGKKLYIYSGSIYNLILDPICRIISISFEGQIYSPSETRSMSIKCQKDVEQLVQSAYENWDSLPEVNQSADADFAACEGNMVVDCSVPWQNSAPYNIEIGGYVELDCSQQLASDILYI